MVPRGTGSKQPRGDIGEGPVDFAGLVKASVLHREEHTISPGRHRLDPGPVASMFHDVSKSLAVGIGHGAG